MADTKKVFHINYEAYFADTESMFDTNVESAAKDNNIYDEKAHYGPVPYIAGSRFFYPEVDQAIGEAEIGKEVEVTIPCEKAAGHRNPKLIELHPIKDFYKNDINPYPGMTVTLQNRTGTILSVGAGRVKVDFNSPLAGHDLTYKVTVLDEVTDPVEKAKAVMEIDFMPAEDFGYAIMEDRVVVTVAEVCKYHEMWPMSKYRLVSDYRAVFGVDRIEFVEVWESARPPVAEEPAPAEDAPKEEAPAEAPAEDAPASE